MLSIFACLVGVLAILLVAEALWRGGHLKYEDHRKFVHIGTGIFVALWPWLVSWRTIELLGLAMAAVVLIDRQVRLFHFSFKLNRQTYGDILFALAITVCALLAHSKIIFALAILNLSVADGVAAVVGNHFGQHFRYKVFGQTKTVIGSMAFWLSSVLILGVGLLFYQVSPHHYFWLLLLLPPALTWLENFAIYGTDNLAVALAVVLALRLIN